MSGTNRLQEAERPCENGSLFLPLTIKGRLGTQRSLVFRGEQVAVYTADWWGKARVGTECYVANLI